jgi:uncharacterized protein (DUF2141 family)
LAKQKISITPRFFLIFAEAIIVLMPAGLKTYLSSFLKLLIPVTIVLYALACATIVSPTGGPKDVTPPKMLKSEPKNLSTNFRGKKILLDFNEYADLKTPEKFILISPPMAETPDLKVKGRSITIKIKDSLRVNTTYNFYLGDAIVDITEGNPITNFNFAFSTGPEIDSLSLTGNVTDAFTRLPVKGALVMLYTDFTDSLPMKHIPVYVSRSLDNGNFRLNNLAAGKYRVVALVDGNSDYMYNLPTETIGFYSDTVQPYYSNVDMSDTNAVKADLENARRISIDMFAEPDSIQRVLKSVIASANRLSIAFRYRMTSPGFKALNVPDTLPWAITEWNNNSDTLNAWLLNKPDTLKLEVSENGKVLDTIRISTSMKVTGKSRNSVVTNYLKFVSSSGNGILGYGKPLMLSFANPVKEYDLTKLHLTIYTKTDTSFVTPSSQFTDSIHRHLLITYKWNSTDKYDLYVPKATFTDIYSDTCDSTHVAFKIRPIEDYGTFVVNVKRTETNYPVIIQLLGEKGVVIDQQSITTEQKVNFGLLRPGKYGLKAIMDVNGNGRWDTGQFIKKIQPERVLVHPKIFEVRTNWDLEETWDL